MKLQRDRDFQSWELLVKSLMLVGKTTCNTLGFPSFQCMSHFHGQVMEAVVNKEGEDIGDKVITGTCTAS